MRVLAACKDLPKDRWKLGTTPRFLRAQLPWAKPTLRLTGRNRLAGPGPEQRAEPCVHLRQLWGQTRLLLMGNLTCCWRVTETRPEVTC